MCGLTNSYVEAKGSMLFLTCKQQQTISNNNSKVGLTNYYGNDCEKILKTIINADTPQFRFKMQHQRPGSGILEVVCLHVGPTLVVRIEDKMDRILKQAKNLPYQMYNKTNITGKLKEKNTYEKQQTISFNATLNMHSGIGISLINKVPEELIYFQLQGVKIHVLKQNQTYQFNGYIDLVQVQDFSFN